MLLRELELENVRSYKHASVRFEDGVTLFEGDIGSGKSTLLYAIEFALFGLGDLKAGFLLRNDAESGLVRLKFDSNGKTFAVKRSLARKRGSVQQGSAFIEEGERRSEYSPEEVKARVLQILGFNENPSPRSTSWIYRYAVFTPQEEMKRVLELDDEERMQTIRKALGVEEYKTARENAGTISRELLARERVFEEATRDLNELEDKLAGISKEKSAAAEQARVGERKARELEESAEKAKREREALRAQLLEFEALSREIPLLERQAVEKTRLLQQMRVEIQKTRFEAIPYETELQERLKVKPPSAGEAQARAALLQAREFAFKANSEASALSSEALNAEDLIKRGKCPTCGQNTSGHEFSHKAEDLKKSVSEKQRTAAQASELEKKAEVQFEEARAYVLVQNRVKELTEWLEKGRVREKQARESEARLGAETSATETELLEKRVKLKQFETAKEKLVAQDSEAKRLEQELRAALQAKTTAETQARSLEIQEADLMHKIGEKKAKRQALQDVREKREWLSNCFAPVLEKIEQSVLGKTHAEFNALFQKHFQTLVEYGDLSVQASEAFTPEVMQNGYEQDYKALSGGEKNALALAYRLALNAVVRENTPSLKDNLLILDEPTDGFSKEQLARVRDVLDEVGARQVLLVSHERELEAFADRVYKIEKKAGESHISA
ncbi:AAA family ATPase [Candidatus Micrarchaeota archaeon]|nr:AAA family ATPase [Candidatus Micrarchaeota archaeon]